MFAGFRSRCTIPEIVGELQRRTERRHDLLHLRDRHPAVCGELLFQGLPVEQFHDQERVILVVHVEVENRDDVGMAETGAGAAFAEESIARSGAAGLRSHDLDRDFVPEQRAPRAIHGAHPSFGQQREDFVTVVEDLAGREHSGIICFRRLAARRLAARYSRLAVALAFAQSIEQQRQPAASRAASVIRRLCCASVSAMVAPLLLALILFLPEAQAAKSICANIWQQHAADFETYLLTAKGRKDCGHPDWRHQAAARLSRTGWTHRLLRLEADPARHARRLLRKLQVGGRRLRTRQAPRPEHGAARGRAAREQRTRRAPSCGSTVSDPGNRCRRCQSRRRGDSSWRG